MIFSREYHARYSDSQFYPMFLCLTAAGLMISGIVPFEVVLIPAVASAPDRWKRICASSVIGSAVGAAVLTFLLETVTSHLLDRLVPSLSTSKGWTLAQGWMDHYGAWALIVISSLPIAQAPALVMAGLLEVAPFEVLLAFLCGKTLKYSLISILTVRSEKKLKQKLAHPANSVPINIGQIK